MDDITPRDHIPENWVEKIRCPYCSTAPMNIVQPAGSPEHFSCPTCELAFRVARADSSIFILHDPIGHHSGYVGQWVGLKAFTSSMRIEPKDEQTKQHEFVNPKVTEGEVDPSELAKDPIYQKYSAEVIKNAADLFELGHGKPQIKDTLSRYSGLKDDEIDEILAYISRAKVSKAKVSIALPQWALGCILVPFLCLLSYAVIVFIQYQTASSFEPGDEPRTISVIELDNLPEGMQTIIPATIMDIAMPIPLIKPLPVSGGEIEACPVDVEGAMALYGGGVDDWEYRSLQKTWTLQSIFAEKIVIPEGHLGVIPTIDEGLSIRLIPGPVEINNSYLIMIRCP